MNLNEQHCPNHIVMIGVLLFPALNSRTAPRFWEALY